LLATYSNNSTALATAQSNNDAAVTMNAADNQTSLFSTLANTIIAPELSKFGQAAGYAPGVGSFNISGGQVPNIAALKAAGYTSGMNVAGVTIP
jgi:hypothetical protein